MRQIINGTEFRRMAINAADAIELNNSEMEPEETFAAALKIIKEKLS